ncbi:uncharacterized protein LOC143181585 [Calliopsis andreniformis]|uniref:uncharacterized protein LOC143181585 n=1 Tax=Calliopsis andreniformis TaxID=337506 RepID=UPI003FCD0A2E
MVPCMEDRERDALWMLEKNVRSIGENQDYVFYDKSKTREPADSYPGVLQMQYVCCDCGRSYKWQDSLKRHQRVDCGNKEKQFACHICDKKFKYRYELRNHVAAQHRIYILRGATDIRYVFEDTVFPWLHESPAAAGRGKPTEGGRERDEHLFRLREELQMAGQFAEAPKGRVWEQGEEVSLQFVPQEVLPPVQTERALSGSP